MPPLTPPPAIHIVKPHGLWSRPSLLSVVGVRPNSPPHSTSVSSRSPRCFKSVSGVAFTLLLMLPVQSAHEIELPTLVFEAELGVVQERDHLLGIEIRMIDVRPLMLGRQKRTAPELGETHGSARTEDDEVGQILI